MILAALQPGLMIPMDLVKALMPLLSVFSAWLCMTDYPSQDCPEV